MISRHQVSIGLVALVTLAGLLLPAWARQTKPAAAALAPIEIVADGLGDLQGIAVDEGGAVFVTDMREGTLVRVVEGASPAVMLDRLKRPMGAAFDREGSLVVVEAGKRRVLRVGADGAPTALVSGLKHPRWIAAAPDGALYVTAKSIGGDGKDGDEEELEPEVIVRVRPEGTAGIVADRFRGLQGVAVDQDVLSAVARGRKGEHHPMGALYEMPIGADGRAHATRLVGDLFLDPVGLAGDRLGARFVSARSLAGQPWHRHVIVKVSRDGRASLFAEGLGDPRGLAFGPDGSLYLAAGKSGRVLRFVAPPPPSLEEIPPRVTRERGITLRVRTEIGAHLTVLGGEHPALATADHNGSAAVAVPLRSNRENRLRVFETGVAGQGLTSAPLELTVIHDDRSPTLELLTPPPGALVRGTIPAEARAADVNGIAQVEFRLDDVLVGLDGIPPYRASIDTTIAADGPHVVSALARDSAGNVAGVAAEVIVDNTPPNVRIVAPAPGVVADGPVEIVVEAADATSGVARVEVAIDGASRFSADTPPFRFQFDPQALGPGPHVLSAAATDRAGNRAESAPVLIARSSLTVTINEPGEGALLPAGLVLVRGRVEAGGGEVGVAVNGIPAAVQGPAFAALVPVDEGTTVLTAVATTRDGLSASHSVAISVSGAQATALVASPEAGAAPLAVRFSLGTTVTPSSIALDFDGNGAVDFVGPSLDGQTFTYTQPGLYFPSVAIAGAQGDQLTARAIVQVFDPNALDALLQAKWAVFKNALRRGDIGGSLQTFAAGTRDRYRPALQALGGDLAAFAVTLGDLQVISFQDGLVEAVTVRLENSQRRVYFVYFVPDDDGIWRIVGM